jgi:hypothetical protein
VGGGGIRQYWRGGHNSDGRSHGGRLDCERDAAFDWVVLQVPADFVGILEHCLHVELIGVAVVVTTIVGIDGALLMLGRRVPAARNQVVVETYIRCRVKKLARPESCRANGLSETGKNHLFSERRIPQISLLQIQSVADGRAQGFSERFMWTR